MTKWSDVDAGTIAAAQQTFWNRCGDNAGVIAPRMRNDPAFAYRMAVRATIDCLRNTERAAHIDAREIMGPNFFGVPESTLLFGAHAPLDRLHRMPYSIELLKRFQKTHILVAVSGLSFNELRQGIGQKFLSSHTMSIMATLNPEMMDMRVSARWLLVKKDAWTNRRNMPNGHCALSRREAAYVSIALRMSDIRFQRFAQGFLVQDHNGTSPYVLCYGGNHDELDFTGARSGENDKPGFLIGFGV